MSGEPAPRWPVVVGIAIGGAFGTVGVVTLLQAADDTKPIVTLEWLIGLAVVHDLVFVPAVLVFGTALGRIASKRAYPRLVGASIVSGVVGLVAWPLVRGYGRSPGNPSILPRNYGVGLVVTLAVVWAATLALLALDHRSRPHPKGPTP